MGDYNYVVDARDYKRMEQRIRMSQEREQALLSEIEGLEEENAALTEELIGLREEKKILDALRAGGVDNWEWYDASLEAME